MKIKYFIYFALEILEASILLFLASQLIARFWPGSWPILNFMLSPEIRAAYEKQARDPLSDGICSDGTNARINQVHGLCPKGMAVEAYPQAPKGIMRPVKSEK